VAAEVAAKCSAGPVSDVLKVKPEPKKQKAKNRKKAKGK
jgi:hypothetical protein